MRGARLHVVALVALLLLFSAGWREAAVSEPVRAVHTLTVGTASVRATLDEAGEVRARTETRLSFTAPMGIAGVPAALLLSDRPFGFVALLGFMALAGMIMRSAVILVDQIEQDRRRGAPAWEAIVESTVRRLRPIVLTAAAAVLAMILLTRSVFRGPMAVAIMGGLIVATA